MIQTKGALKRLQLLRDNPGLKDKLWVNVDALQKWIERKDLTLGILIPVYSSLS
jgi:glycine C-acetyltransferase